MIVEVVCVVLVLLTCAYRCARARSDRRRSEEEANNPALREYRERRRAGRARPPPAQATAVAEEKEEEEPPPDRSELIDSRLFTRKVNHEDEAKSLISILSGAHGGDRAAGASGDHGTSTEHKNYLSRKWDEAVSSVRTIGTRPECSICLDHYEKDETLAWGKNDKCNHVYHEECIRGWLAEHDDCPLCRTNLMKPDVEEGGGGGDGGGRNPSTTPAAPSAPPVDG